jgi:two-component system, chemotaxis family, sensor kinase CheA
VRVSEVLESKRQKAADGATQSLQVVVYVDQGRSVGLVVDRILDVVEEGFSLQQQSQRKGVKGSAVIQHKITEILDVPGLLAASASSKALAAHA